MSENNSYDALRVDLAAALSRAEERGMSQIAALMAALGIIVEWVDALRPSPNFGFKDAFLRMVESHVSRISRTSVRDRD